MAFCTFCGTQVPDDIKFCTSCGKPMGITVKVPAQPVQPVQQVQPQAPSPPPQPQPQPQQAPPVYTQPQAAPPPQQAYVAPPAQPYAAQPYAAQPYAPAPDPNALPPGSKYEPITTGGFIGIMLLMMLPIVNFILLLVWACGGCRKVNKTNFARAMLIIMLISAVLSGIIFLIFGSMFGSGLSDITDALKSLE